MTYTSIPSLLDDEFDESSEMDFQALFSAGNLARIFEQDIAPRGGRGLDRISTSTFRKRQNLELAIVERKCISGDYLFTPYLQRLKTKGAGKIPREISVPTVRDRIVLHALKEYLHDCFPERVRRTLPNNYVRDVAKFVAGTSYSSLKFIRADVKSFYDEIAHEPLLSLLRERLPSQEAFALIRRAIRNPSAPMGQRYFKLARKTRGVPQGLAISNILSDIYLHEFDEKCRNHAVVYRRYVDDILVFVNETSQMMSVDWLKRELAALHLECGQDKTFTGNLTDSFEYLGYQFRLPKITVRQTSVAKLLDSIAAKLSADKNRQGPGTRRKETRLYALMEDINERLTGAVYGNRRYGWIFFFLEMNDLSLLYTIDATVKKMLDRHAELRKTQPLPLKSIVRAFYEARYNPTGGYAHDYTAYANATIKRQFLVRHGYMTAKEAEQRTDSEIMFMFDRVREQRLNQLDEDVGLMY